MRFESSGFRTTEGYLERIRKDNGYSSDDEKEVTIITRKRK